MTDPFLKALQAMNAASAGAGAPPVPTQEAALVAGLVRALKPRLVCEIGPGTGAVTVEIARALGELEGDRGVVVVDSWRGSLSEWCDAAVVQGGGGVSGDPKAEFAAAMEAAGVAERVALLPQHPPIAAEILDFHGVRPGMVICHCDAGRGSVVEELRAFHALMGGAGLLVCRDASPWVLPNLRRQLWDFARDCGQPVEWVGPWMLVGAQVRFAVAQGGNGVAAPAPSQPAVQTAPASRFAEEDEEILIPVEALDLNGDDRL